MNLIKIKEAMAQLNAEEIAKMTDWLIEVMNCQPHDTEVHDDLNHALQQFATNYEEEETPY